MKECVLSSYGEKVLVYCVKPLGQHVNFDIP